MDYMEKDKIREKVEDMKVEYSNDEKMCNPVEVAKEISSISTISEDSVITRQEVVFHSEKFDICTLRCVLNVVLGCWSVFKTHMAQMFVEHRLTIMVWPWDQDSNAKATPFEAWGV